MRLSVLDQSVAVAGRGEDAAIRDTIALAAHCEALGYHRFWVSEHHSLQTIVGTAPEIVMAAIGATTSRIRIGSAGVMLPHYSALKVAEQFRVLDAIAPGRIDLGVGRAPGSDMRTALALNPNAHHAAETFPAQVRDLQVWVAGQTLEGITAHPRANAAAAEEAEARTPQLWILGSSDYGAQLAAHFGLPYAFAYFFSDGRGADTALRLYRELYKPSQRHPAPQATLCDWARVADSGVEAWHAALSRERWRIDRMRGAFGALQSPEDVAARGFAADELATLEPMRHAAFVGSAATVGAKLRALAAQFQLDELVVNTWATDPRVRRHSYALLASEFGLA
jgi:luciferase family oxidoreductase group 1